jgi:hypothetical protein
MTKDDDDAGRLAVAAAILGRRGGKVGGRARGARKRRGDTAYYRELSRKGVAARRKVRKKA